MRNYRNTNLQSDRKSNVSNNKIKGFLAKTKTTTTTTKTNKMRAKEVA